MKTITIEFQTRLANGERCHSSSDGECEHKNCPQLRDNEPKSTGRHCPLDVWGDDEGRAGG